MTHLETEIYKVMSYAFIKKYWFKKEVFNVTSICTKSTDIHKENLKQS